MNARQQHKISGEKREGACRQHDLALAGRRKEDGLSDVWHACQRQKAHETSLQLLTCSFPPRPVSPSLTNCKVLPPHLLVPVVSLLDLLSMMMPNHSPSSLPWAQAPPRPLTPVFDSPVFHSLRISRNQFTFCGLLAPSYPHVSVLLFLSAG